MDYFGSGIRELQRVFTRLNHRIRLSGVKRRLAAAETELGLLGWQQADFDEATQSEVDKIQDVEREQARLTNAGAEVGKTIRELTEKRDAARREADARGQQSEAGRARVREPLEALEKQLAALRKSERDYERAIPELDREQREVDALYAKLLIVQPQSAKVREELLRQRDRLIAIPNEKADLRAQHVRTAAELQTKEKDAAVLGAQLAEIDRQVREFDTTARATEAKLTGELRDAEKEKARLDAEIDKLERAKTNPYREIGRVLADSNLPPRNQPHILEKVKTLRFSAQEHEYELANSLHQSAQEDQTGVRLSLALWAVLLVALALLLAALL